MSVDPSAITIGIPREQRDGERRVAMSPAALGPLLKAGASVLIESGAGEAAGFTDAAYADKGAIIVSRAEATGARVVLRVQVDEDAVAATHPGQIVIGLATPLAGVPTVPALAEKGATLLAMELVPRTTRAQAMDALSSQANIAGYKAVLLGAAQLQKVFPLLTTAAGTIPPAKILIVGAGVAGLSAIATARRLGALVEAYDVRPAVKEEVESLGARFVELPLDTGQEGGGSGAYARQMTEEQLAKQQELLAKTVAGSDVVITTAQVQGAKAPVIVTTAMVEQMAAGSVIVDLAAEQGGNCELTRAGEIVDHRGVQVIGPVNVPSSVAAHSSLVYAKNVANLLALMIHDGVVDVDVDDDIVRDTLVTRDGEIVHNRVREVYGLAPIAAPEPPPAPEPEPAAESGTEEASA
jgi:H+-translocating NAD(P) transhydrogenase subunit alpha